MDVIRRFGVYIVAGVLIVCAVALYFIVVSKKAEERDMEFAQMESRRGELEGYATSQIPNDALVEEVRTAAEREKEVLDRCEEYLADQPRLCHTRPFYQSERVGHPDYGKPIRGEVAWLDEYERRNNLLRERLYVARMPIWIEDIMEQLGARLPTVEQMQEATEMYWFQHDLVELLTDGTEAAFQSLIDQIVPDDGFPQSPAGLVIDPKPGTLDEKLRAVPRSEDLEAVLKAIIINDGNADLATIFDEHLAEDFPWRDVLKYTMSDEQTLFLSRIRPGDQPDLSNHQRFVDYVMELRSVRYRADVVALLERHEFGRMVVEYHLDRQNREDIDRFTAALKLWSKTRLAQAIAAVVSIQNEEDYSLVRDNHALNLRQTGDMTFARPYEAPKREPGMGGYGEDEYLYEDERFGRGTSDTSLLIRARKDQLSKATAFDFSVRIEFKRIPVFVRRFLNNSWHYTMRVKSVVPMDEAGDIGDDRRFARRDRDDEISDAAYARLGRGPTGRRIARGRDKDEDTESVSVSRKFVWIDLACEGRQYTPLRKKLNQPLGTYSEEDSAP